MKILPKQIKLEEALEPNSGFEKLCDNPTLYGVKGGNTMYIYLQQGDILEYKRKEDLREMSDEIDRRRY